MLIRQPTAGIEEALTKHFLHQTYGVATFATAPAPELMSLEGHRSVMVVVEWTQRLVVINREP
jgi:hypothetical protein